MENNPHFAQSRTEIVNGMVVSELVRHRPWKNSRASAEVHPSF